MKKRFEKTEFVRKAIRKTALLFVMALSLAVASAMPVSAAGAAFTKAALLKDKNVVNILFVEKNGKSAGSFTILTMNQNTGQVSQTTVAKNMVLQVSKSSREAVSRVYADGGAGQLKKALTENFGMQIAGSMEADFGQLPKLIDKMDGIDVTLTRDEADYICGIKQDVKNPQKLREDWKLHAGTNHLNGQQAWIHRNNRSFGASKEQEARQKAVLGALAKRVKAGGVVSMTKFLKNALKLVETDLSFGKLLKCGLDAVSMDLKNPGSYQLPAGGSYQCSKQNGKQILIPDLKKNRDYVKRKLYGMKTGSKK